MSVEGMTQAHYLQHAWPPHDAHPVRQSGKMHASYLFQPAEMFVEIDIILHCAGPSLCRALQMLGNNLTRTTKIPKIQSRTKIALYLVLSTPLCSHTSTALGFCSLQREQRGPQSMWFVVGTAWNFHSQAEYLNLCQLAVLPFILLFKFFFLPLSNCLFFLSCLSSQTASVLSISAFVQQLLTARLSLSSLAGCWTSLPSASPLPLSQVPLWWGVFSLWGFQKGHKGGENFLQHMLVRCVEKGVCLKKKMEEQERGRRRLLERGKGVWIKSFN